MGISIERFTPYLLAVLRVVAGLLFLSHGLVKLFGFPPGVAPGPQSIMTLFGAGGIIEFGTGTLILLGLFTRPAAFLASGEMAAAYWMFHFPRAGLPVANGGDAAILFCFLFLFFVFAGPGAFSLDGLRGSVAAPRERLARG